MNRVRSTNRILLAMVAAGVLLGVLAVLNLTAFYIVCVVGIVLGIIANVVLRATGVVSREPRWRKPSAHHTS